MTGNGHNAMRRLAASMPSRSIQMQRICERTYEVRLSAPVGQKPEVGFV